MNFPETLCELDELIQSRSILHHPFYVAWRDGELTRKQLATYARVYWPHVAAFPAYLESVIALTDDADVRSKLQCNLDDERSHPRSHSEMWLNFAEELGEARQDVCSARPHACAVTMVDTVKKFTQSSVTEGVAALYAYEVQQPGVAREKCDGLRRFYGVESVTGLEYFVVHAEADVAHSQGERAVLTRCLDGSDVSERILSAATDTLDAYCGLLDGICRTTGVATA
jgi:pyrroloquinoline-quinone synthase